MKRLWARIVLAWSVLWRGLPPAPTVGHAFQDEVRRLMTTKSWRAALYAVDKIRKQPRLAVAGHDLQKDEAEEWSHTFNREMLGTKQDGWTVRFLIELAIGIEKGRLPTP